MGCMEVGMTKGINISDAIESIALLKGNSLKELDATSAIDKVFINNPDLKEILDNYILLTNPELTGVYLKTFQNDLKQDILEYHEEKLYINSLDDLPKIAFFRLQKISKKHYLESTYGCETEKIQALKIQALKIKKEYELLSAII